MVGWGRLRADDDGAVIGNQVDRHCEGTQWQPNRSYGQEQIQFIDKQVEKEELQFDKPTNREKNNSFGQKHLQETEQTITNYRKFSKRRIKYCFRIFNWWEGIVWRVKISQDWSLAVRDTIDNRRRETQKRRL